MDVDADRAEVLEVVLGDDGGVEQATGQRDDVAVPAFGGLGRAVGKGLERVERFLVELE